MSEWKGLWKCELCGFLSPKKLRQHDTPWNDGIGCSGDMIPYERRAADERVRELVDALSRKISDDCPPGYDAKAARCPEKMDCSACWQDWFAVTLRKYEKE